MKGGFSVFKGFAYVLLLAVSALAQTATDRSSVSFQTIGFNYTKTFTPTQENLTLANDATPNLVVVRAFQDLATLAATDSAVAAVLAKYGVSVTAADGSPLFPPP